jgi:hypothetical protein
MGGVTIFTRSWQPPVAHFPRMGEMRQRGFEGQLLPEKRNDDMARRSPLNGMERTTIVQAEFSDFDP